MKTQEQFVEAAALLNPSDRAYGYFHDKNGPFVEYNPEWANGTGYLDGAVTDLSIWDHVDGSRCRSIDDNGRRILIAKTQFGNVVIFERRKQDDSEDPTPWVSNAPNVLSQTLIPSGITSNSAMSIFFQTKYDCFEDSPYNRLLKAVLSN